MLCSKSKIIIILCLLTGTTCRAQYHPVYSQYMFNGLALNPAYAGSQEVLSLSALYRGSQWSGFEGAPTTQTLAGDFPLRNPQIALGLLVFNDQISIFRQTGVFTSYAFRVKVGPGKLSFGLQAGFEQMREDESKIKTLSPSDPMFDNEIHKSFMPNAGFGMYYYAPKCFIGLSIPQLLAYSPYTANEYKSKVSPENVMLHGGVTIPLGKNFKIRPSTLLQYTQKDFLCDLNCNFIMFPEDRLELGVSYRNNSTLVAMTEIRINSQLCLGYAFDYTFGLSNITTFSHEVMVRYDFKFRVKAEDPSYLKR